MSGISITGTNQTFTVNRTNLTAQESKLINKNVSTTEDNVLDLSDNSKIAAELLKQNKSTILAIKINNQLIKAPDQETLMALIDNLTKLCLDENKNLKSDFKFLDFQEKVNPANNKTKDPKTTTINLNVVSSSLDNTTFNNLSNLSKDSRKALNSLSRDLNAYDKDNQITAGKKPDYLKLNGNLNTQTRKIDDAVESLKTKSDNPEVNQRIEELGGQKKSLETAKQLVKLAQNVANAEHKLLNVGSNKELLAAKANLTNAVSEFHKFVEANKQYLPESMCKPSESIINSANSVSSEMLSLGKNPSLRNNLPLLNRNKDAASIIEQYGKYIDLRTGKSDSYRSGRANETLNPSGFINSTFNDVRDDINWAGKVKDLSARINSGADGTQIISEARAMFKSASGKYIIKEQNVNSICSILEAQIKCRDAAASVTQAEMELSKQDPTRFVQADAFLTQAKESNSAAAKLNAVKLTGFGKATTNAGEAIRASNAVKIESNNVRIDKSQAKSDALRVKYEATKNMQDVQKLAQAKYWFPGSGDVTGSEGNILITDTYHKMDKGFTVDYLGTGENGDVPSWITFAKSGSGSAGVQIGNIETALEAIKQLTNGYTDPIEDGKALNALRSVIGQPGIVGQFALLAESIVNKGINKIDPDLIKRGLSDVQRMRTALVEGNTEIYRNAIPLYQGFLNGENGGGKGLESVKALINDPDGLWSDKSVKQQLAYHLGRKLTPDEEKMAVAMAAQNKELIVQAFSGYKEAHNLSEKAKTTTNPEEKKQLLRKHDELIKQANIDFVSFEQLFAQPIYNKIHDLTGATAGTVRLFDANHPPEKGGIRLLTNLGPDKRYKGTIDAAESISDAGTGGSGNWGDFTTRMGFVPLKEGEQGAKTLIVPVPVVVPGEPITRMEMKKVTVGPDPRLRNGQQGLPTNGTISDYFLNTSSGQTTDNLINKNPPKANKTFTYNEPQGTFNRGIRKVGNKIVDGGLRISPIPGSSTVVEVKPMIQDGLNGLKDEAAKRKTADDNRKKEMENSYQ